MNKIWNLPKIELMPFSEVDEKRPVLLVTSSPAWNAVKGYLGGLNIVASIEVTEASKTHWDNLKSSIGASHSLPSGQTCSAVDQKSEVVYAVGGGLSVDAAKYLALNFGLPLTCLPTVLSADAFLTAASGIRRDGCVIYIETKPPETLILDLEVIGAAPASIRAAGITDVMSIATGAWDWQFAHEQDKNPPGMEFIPWEYEIAQSILKGVLDCAEAAGAGDHDGLKTLFDCLALEVQLCNQIGHARPEEGSEHYFAYAVENEIGHGLPHGDLVGPGILLIAERQGQQIEPLQRALSACNVPLNHISPAIVQHTLEGLPAYCIKHNLPFGIAHTL